MELNIFKPSDKEESVPEAPKSKNCKACKGTGLDRTMGLAEAKACPVCNGSPKGEPQADIDARTPVQAEAQADATDAEETEPVEVKE